MPFEYITVDEAIARDGLRMVVVSNVPSPWGEAAKGIFHVKGLDWAAVRLAYDNPALDAWAGQQSGPVAIYNDEPPKDGWEDILLLAERLAPEPRLLPEADTDRNAVLSLSGNIIGSRGLAWWRRLQLVAAGLNGQGGFPEPVAKYIGAKYGFDAAMGAAASDQTVGLLNTLSDRLKAQKAAGHDYLFGEALSAADVYCAAAMALFAPLPEAQCAMNPNTRGAFNTQDAATQAALDPALIAHRDMMYTQHLELPLSL